MASSGLQSGSVSYLFSLCCRVFAKLEYLLAPYRGLGSSMAVAALPVKILVKCVSIIPSEVTGSSIII